MKKFLLIILIALINNSITAQVNVKIIVFAPGLSDTEKVFITGSLNQIGNWNPSAISLDKINDSTFSKSFNFPSNYLVEFKFTKGTWLSEALETNNTAPDNYKIKFINDSTLTFTVKSWGKISKKPMGQITGNVRYHKNFGGAGILPRDIIVWLPSGYDSVSDKRYPVLYMHDGQNIIDPLTSAFGIDWQIDETVDSLISSKLIQEIIIVGIYNTNNRGSEYLETQTGYAYLNFIVGWLKPYIDSNYNTLADNQNTAVAGSSLGGIISFMLVWEFPEIFSKAACLSPAFKIDAIDFVDNVKNYSGSKKDIKIFIYNGGIGLEEILQPGVDEMLGALNEKGFTEGVDLNYIRDSLAEHNETAWAKHTHNFLQYFFPAK